MQHTTHPWHVGDVVIAGTFRVSPLDVANFARAQAHRAAASQPGRAHPSAHPVFGPEVDLRRVPASLLVSHAIARMEGASSFGAFRVSVAHIGRLRELERVVVGEPLTVVATVRYRSGSSAQAHLTLRVELRRPGGAVVGRFELGLDLRPRAGGGHAHKAGLVAA